MEVLPVSRHQHDQRVRRWFWARQLVGDQSDALGHFGRIDIARYGCPSGLPGTRRLKPFVVPIADSRNRTILKGFAVALAPRGDPIDLPKTNRYSEDDGFPDCWVQADSETLVPIGVVRIDCIGRGVMNTWRDDVLFGPR